MSPLTQTALALVPPACCRLLGSSRSCRDRFLHRSVLGFFCVMAELQVGSWGDTCLRWSSRPEGRVFCDWQWSARGEVFAVESNHAELPPRHATAHPALSPTGAIVGTLNSFLGIYNSRLLHFVPVSRSSNPCHVRHDNPFTPLCSPPTLDRCILSPLYSSFASYWRSLS